ncbi:TPA: ATP-binding protein [Pseudomonas aeruginosa]
MATKTEKLSVDTSPSKEVVVNSLTRDIAIDACIFDLIDNSIDAARDTIFKLDQRLDKDSPPESYEKYKIKIDMDGVGISISDNCGGISSKLLEASALRFGERSSHNLGIGVFGVGLNRAIFRIGKFTDIETDTGTERCQLEIKTDDYLKSKNWSLPALKMPSQGRVGTIIRTTGLSSETSSLFADAEWVRNLRRETGIRYGKLIEKGLEIIINNEPVEAHVVELRKDNPYGNDSKFFRVANTTVYIEAGQHKRHRFSAEPDYNKDENAGLTSEYGWTIYCNERAIVISDKSWKTGWVKKFHSEFYGFVGNVYFTNPNPSELPWNTTKTDVDLNNSAYQYALEDMRKFVDKWRANAGDAKRRKNKDEPLVVPHPNPTSGEGKGPAQGPTQGANPNKPKGGKPASSPVKKPPTTKIDHNNFSTVLPPDIDELHCDDKHLALVHEGKRLDLNTMTYIGLVLIRMLFEASTIKFLVRKEKYDELLNKVITERNSARAKKNLAQLNKKEISNLEPDLDELINFLVAHDDVWDAARKNKIQHSLRRFLTHKKLLNSAAHNTFQTINKLVAFEIRDDILPALRYLIEE